jgi:hypothetical protein
MSELAPVFDALRAILKPYAARLVLKTDSASDFYLDTHHVLKNKQPLFFAAASVKKNYVSFYLMPVYVEPKLLAGVSKPLKARMQGKSCFNFDSVDKDLLKELAALTKAGYASYKTQGFV